MYLKRRVLDAAECLRDRGGLGFQIYGSTFIRSGGMERKITGRVYKGRQAAGAQSSDSEIELPVSV